MTLSLRAALILLVAIVAVAAPAGAQIEPPGGFPTGAPSAEAVPSADPVPSALPEIPEPQASGDTPSPPPIEDEEKVETPSWLEIAATPVFGASSLPMGGWAELIVRINNKSNEPAKGEVTIFGGLARFAKEAGNRTYTPYSVAAGASVSLRIPVRVSERADPMVRVHDADKKKIFELSFPRAVDNRTLVVDVAKASVLAAALRGVPVGSRNDPWAFSGYSGAASSSYGGTATPSTVEMTSPLYDETTGDPLLPRRAAGYARVAAVVMRSEELVRLPAEELEALSGYTLSGGTLAVIITRPEDMRNAVVTALTGGEIKTTAVQPETKAELVLTPLPSSSTPSPGLIKPPPVAAGPEPDLEGLLSGYEGGNLHHTAYGASATYGLGEVHILAFDPQTKPGVDSPWVHVRVIDMARRANERVSGVLFRHGDKHNQAAEVRRQLDPNESSRWAIVLTALLLCLYAIVAGPVNFAIWRKRGRPLRALVWLPIAAATAFGSVVVVGVIAKGCSGRSRHLTLVEAGAGMKSGSARRWRGFFVPTARELTVRTGNASSVLGVELMNHGDEGDDNLRVDRDGLRLEKVQVRPWETLVVREDGYADLGGGVSILAVSDKEVKVKNKTGRGLRGLVLSLPWGEVKYLAKLDDNASASSTDFSKTSRVTSTSSPAGMPLREFNMFSIETKLDAASPGLTNAWQAVQSCIGGHKDWFPSDVPVLLAQLDGGEGDQSDTGLTVDTDRVLVRVVGYGGI